MNNPDRRTPTQFLVKEAARIQQLVVTEDAELVCPRCGGELSMGDPIAGGHSIAMVWEVSCLACRRSIMIRDLPEKARASFGKLRRRSGGTESR